VLRRPLAGPILGVLELICKRDLLVVAQVPLIADPGPRTEEPSRVVEEKILLDQLTCPHG